MGPYPFFVWHYMPVWPSMAGETAAIFADGWVAMAAHQILARWGAYEPSAPPRGFAAAFNARSVAG